MTNSNVWYNLSTVFVLYLSEIGSRIKQLYCIRFLELLKASRSFGFLATVLCRFISMNQMQKNNATILGHFVNNIFEVMASSERYV